MTRHDPAPGGPVTTRNSTPEAVPTAVQLELKLSHTAVSLGNRILAGLTPGDVLLICGLTSHRGVGDLAMMVARAAAGLSGLRVLLVDAQSVHATSVTPHVPDGAPGFTDLLAGVPLTPAMIHSGPDSPVRMVGPGTRPDLAGANCLMAATAGIAVAALRAEADILCLVGAPLCRSVGTASLAKHAQATVLCVHRVVDRRDAVVQAVTDLGATGTRLLGTVLLR